ncbi:MAG: hypothetical protein ACLRFE_00765 [Clostridia bacterium]
MNNLVSSKVKFSRNLKDAKFVTTASNIEKAQYLDLCLKAVNDCGLKGDKLDNISNIIDNLIKTDKIEQDFVTSLAGKGYASNEDVVVQINNQSHIEILSQGIDLFTSYSNAKQIDKKLCNKLNFAYNDKYGFLGADLQSLGSGLNIECKVMLPALNQINAIKMLPKANDKLLFEIKCLDEDSGLYLISTKGNLGYSEKQICELTYSYIDKVIKYEIQTCQKLADEDIDEIMDCCSRAKAVLKNCIKIESREVYMLVANIMIAINAGVETEINFDKLNQIINMAKLFDNQKELAKNIQKIIK